MRSARRLLTGIGAMLALAVLASSAPAAAANPALIITKECSEYVGTVPSFCTITASNFPAIPPGTKVVYYGPLNADPDYTSSTVIISVENGGLTGYCSLLGNVGTCSFWAGTGTLAGFHAAVQVTFPKFVDRLRTPNPGYVFRWEGTYRLDVP